MKLIELVNLIFCVTGTAYFIESFFYARFAKQRDREQASNASELLSIRRAEMSTLSDIQRRPVAELTKRMEEARAALAAEMKAHGDLKASLAAKKGKRCAARS